MSDHTIAPAPGQFCTRHFSWLCQAGQGRCQTETESIVPDQTTAPADSVTPQALRTIRAAYKAGRDVVLGCPDQAEIIGILDRLDWRVRVADRENARLLTLLARTGEERDRLAAHIQAMLAEHEPAIPQEAGEQVWCNCGVSYPCPTRRAVEGEQ